MKCDTSRHHAPHAALLRKRIRDSWVAGKRIVGERVQERLERELVGVRKVQLPRCTCQVAKYRIEARAVLNAIVVVIDDFAERREPAVMPSWSVRRSTFRNVPRGGLS